MRKKRILIHSNHHKAFTGFGKTSKNILKYLSSIEEYDVFEAANGLPYSEEPVHSYNSWNTFGTIPSDYSSSQLFKKGEVDNFSVSYGILCIDKIIEKVQPDIYIGIEDIWAFKEIVKKPWWNKINCMIWTTIDSLPILPDAIQMSRTIKNYYVWSQFAEDYMRKMNINHVKTLHGPIDCSKFYKLKSSQKNVLRDKFSIDRDCFIFGFVFRNQLRKTVGDLIHAFKIFKENHPLSKPKLLLHTNWREGWDIIRLCNDYKVPLEDVLTTYICPLCRNYTVKSFSGHFISCNNCGCDKMQTTSTSLGVSESQLNQIYNLMDMYVHPFTSGGQEIPIQEAKLCELITAVTNYTCGIEMASNESAGFALKWNPYREIGTQFFKASTDPFDISTKMEKVFNMSESEKKQMGVTARNFILKNYSIESCCSELVNIINNLNFIEFKKSFLSIPSPNINYIPSKNFNDPKDLVIDLYSNMLNQNPESDYEKINEILSHVYKNKLNPNDIYKFFKKITQDFYINNFNKKVTDFFNENYHCKRISITIPEDINIALIISLFIPELKKRYDNYEIHIFCSHFFHDIFYPYQDYFTSINPRLIGDNNLKLLEGDFGDKKIFDISYIIDSNFFDINQYFHNGEDK